MLPECMWQKLQKTFYLFVTTCFERGVVGERSRSLMNVRLQRTDELISSNSFKWTFV